MKSPIKKVSLAIVLCLLISCSSEPKNQDVDAALIEHVEKNRIGVSTDVWLERKSNLSGNWDKVALFFGMVGDRGVCEQVIASLKETSKEDLEIRCTDADQDPQTGEDESLEQIITNNQGDRAL